MMISSFHYVAIAFTILFITCAAALLSFQPVRSPLYSRSSGLHSWSPMNGTKDSLSPTSIWDGGSEGLGPFIENPEDDELETPSTLANRSLTRELSLEDPVTKRTVWKREAPYRRRRGFGMPGGSGATSDRIRFSSFQKDLNKAADEVVVPKTKKPPSRWFVTFGNSTGLLDTTLPPPTLRTTNTTKGTQDAAEAAFRVRIPWVEDQTAEDEPLGRNQKTEKKAKQLSSLLNVTLGSARRMIWRAPSLQRMDIKGTVAKRCVEISVLLRCTPKQFTSIVKRLPSILTFRAETSSRKLVQLDSLLSGKSANDTAAQILNDDQQSSLISTTESIHDQQSLTTESISVNVSDTTLSIARRVPRLLASNITGTLHSEAVALYNLLFGEHSRERSHEAFAKVLRRCPELLLYNVEDTISPKLDQLVSLLITPLGKSGYSAIDKSLDTITSQRDLGAWIAIKEPRLLVYDIDESLAPQLNSGGSSGGHETIADSSCCPVEADKAYMHSEDSDSE